MSKFPLILFFAVILAAMTWVTTIASLDRSVITAAPDIWNDLWARATLFDAYFGFLTFYLWILYKQRGIASRLAWLVAILLLGNFAMAAYALRELFRLKTGEGFDVLLTRRYG